MSIRVLYLHEFTRIGGAERALLGLAGTIRQMGVEPLVAWPRKDSASTWLRSRGVHVVPLKVPSWSHGLCLPLLPLFLGRLRRNVVHANVDLVHVNNYRSARFGQLVSRWMGVPSVCHVRELITSEKVRRSRLRASDALIAVADAVARVLIEGGVPPHRVTTVRSGITLRAVPNQEERAGVRDRLGISDADWVMGIVAHILPHKGYDDLVQALALIKAKAPNVRCLIVGEAPRKRYLHRLLQCAERLSVRDRMTLVGKQDEVAPFLHAMDLFVLPSRTEGLPITILEAMAAGRPVVAAAVGGIPEVVRDGETGLLVPERDPRRLADAVLRLLETPGFARAMGEAGRKRIEEAFTLEREARQTSQVYRHLLAERSADSIHDHPGGQV